LRDEPFRDKDPFVAIDRRPFLVTAQGEMLPIFFGRFRLPILNPQPFWLKVQVVFWVYTILPTAYLLLFWLAAKPVRQEYFSSPCPRRSSVPLVPHPPGGVRFLGILCPNGAVPLEPKHFRHPRQHFALAASMGWQVWHWVPDDAASGGSGKGQKGNDGKSGGRGQASPPKGAGKNSPTGKSKGKGKNLDTSKGKGKGKSKSRDPPADGWMCVVCLHENRPKWKWCNQCSEHKSKSFPPGSTQVASQPNGQAERPRPWTKAEPAGGSTGGKGKGGVWTPSKGGPRPTSTTQAGQAAPLSGSKWFKPDEANLDDDSMGVGDSGEPTPNPKLQAAIATCETNLAGLTRLLREAEKNFGQGHAISESLRQEWQAHQDKLEALRRDKLESLPKHVLLKRKEQARDQTKTKLGKTERAIQETKAQLEAAQKRLEELAVQQSEQQIKFDNLQKEVAALAMEVVHEDPNGSAAYGDLNSAVEEAKAAAARAEAASARALEAKQADRSDDVNSAAEEAQQAAAAAAAALKRAQEAQSQANAKRQHKA
jgi:hypothetical protein